MIGKRKNGGRRLLESTIKFLWGKLEVAGYKLAMDDMISLYSGTGLTFYKNLPMYFIHSNLCRAREDRHTHFTDKEIKSPEDCGLVTYLLIWNWNPKLTILLPGLLNHIQILMPQLYHNLSETGWTQHQ